MERPLEENVYSIVRGGFRAAKGQKKASQDKFLSREELQALLRAARADARVSGKDAWALFALAGNFGLRCGEAIDLGREDFKTLSFGYFRVRTLKRRAKVEDRVYTGRDGKALVEEVLELRKAAGRADSLFPISTRTARYLFAYYADRAGLSPNVSFHSLRHTTARMILVATGGGDPTKGSMRIVKAILRHRPTPSEIYTEPTPDELIRAMDQKGAVR